MAVSKCSSILLAGRGLVCSAVLWFDSKEYYVYWRKRRLYFLPLSSVGITLLTFKIGIMIHEVTMYGATCDHCKNDWYDDHNGWCAMSDESSIKDVLSEEGWCRGDESMNEGIEGEYYCPECWSYDDEDNFILDASRKDKYK